MIVTRKWLQEWVDISDIDTDTLCRKLNSVGLEVDSVKELTIPKGVVVGKVLSCEKHPDADKLSVCQVDIGTGVSQIVCGAKNVAAGLFVCVATPGADLGGGFVIKEAKLRGVDSFGMICGADEIGLPEMNEGILILDDSIGELKIGKELREYELLCDTIIDIELTANRGDCLSVRGVARDLAAAFSLELKSFAHSLITSSLSDKKIRLDIKDEPECSLMYRIVDINECGSNLLKSFRLACVDMYGDDPFRQNLRYSIHSYGVILRAYDFDKCSNDSGEAHLSLKSDERGVVSLYHEGSLLSAVGLYQNGEFGYNGSKSAIIEASYIDPGFISEIKTSNDIKEDDLYYNTSRGSESDLEGGINYFCGNLQLSCDVSIDENSYDYIFVKERKTVVIDLSYIYGFIGQEIDKESIVSILKRLGFGCELFEGSIKVVIPDFRADIEHSQDIIEEIVRITGIDNIKSKALKFTESRRLNSYYDLYKKRIRYRQKAAGSGFFESVHYFFDNRKLMRKYETDILSDEFDLLNPITEELNTLRTTLVLNLIRSASRNIKNSYKSVRLFELGNVVDSVRVQSEKMAFVFSGQISEASVSNHGKPPTIDFFTFCEKISGVTGEFELKKDDEQKALYSPYEQARVIIDGRDAGIIARIHADVEKEFDLPRTYICELDFDALSDGIVTAGSFSKFPTLNRDLSLLVPKSFTFRRIKDSLKESLPEEIKSFYPIDIYSSEELGENLSLTVRFEIGSDEKTLNEEEINSIVGNILETLKESLGIVMR